MNSLEVEYENSWLSPVSAITALLSAVGPPVKDFYAAGMSGFAFRIAVQDQLLPGAMNSNFIWSDTFLSAFDKLGIVVEMVQCESGHLLFDRYQNLLWEKIAQSIKSGRPVLVWENHEFGLTSGIDLEKAIWACHGVSGKVVHPKTSLGKGDVPVLFGVVPLERVEVNKRDAIVMALRVAVSVGFISRPPYPSGYNTVTGIEAYRKWADELDGDFNRFGNSYLAQVVLESRRCAALFLANVASEFEEISQNLLLRASERFAQVHGKIKYLASVFPFPGNTPVTNEFLDKSVSALQDCYVMETEGLKLISTALERFEAHA